MRVSSEKEDTQHGGVRPKLNFDASGRLYIAYRTLHAPVSGWTMYYWDITRMHAGWPQVDGSGPAGEQRRADRGTVRHACGRWRGVCLLPARFPRSKLSNDGNMAPKLAIEAGSVLRSPRRFRGT